MNLMPALINAARADVTVGEMMGAMEKVFGRHVEVPDAVTVRVLVAKVGLDGHDRGIKVVARLLRDAGMEVVYTGLFQTPETVAIAAIQEDVDVVGLSMLSGAHLTLAPLVVEALRSKGSDIPVIVGGIVPNNDLEDMSAAGVAAVFGPGASADEMVASINQVVSQAGPSVVLRRVRSLRRRRDEFSVSSASCPGSWGLRCRGRLRASRRRRLGSPPRRRGRPGPDW